MAGRRAQTTRESRAILIEAATELFAERGYRQTTFADIAERSGISRGSIPWHFGNKEGLLEAVVEHLVDALRRVETTQEPGPDALGQALAQARDFTRQPATRLFITLIAEAVEPDSPLHAHYAQLQDTMRAHLAARLDPVTLPAGMTTDDLAVVLLGAITGIHQQWRISPKTVDLDRVYDTLTSLLTAALGTAAVPEPAEPAEQADRPATGKRRR